MDKRRFTDKVMQEENFCHLYHERIGLILAGQWWFVFPQGFECFLE